jgi:hypothetical protein
LKQILFALYLIQDAESIMIGSVTRVFGASGGLLLYQYIQDYRLGASLEDRRMLDTLDHDDGEGEYELQKV